MAIGDDFDIDYVNKRIYHKANNNVYTVRELYSWLMDVFDELVQMDNPVPMSAQTPTEFTLENEWFLDVGEGSEAHKYLKGGALQTSGWNGKIQVLDLDAITADPVASDIGKQVNNGSDIGELLGYIIDPYGTNTGKWYIRSTTTISDNDSITITGGTGAGTANGDSRSGENLWANIYTLGTIESSPAPQIYVFQAGAALSEWSDKTNWDRGHIDVLILVKEASVEFNDGIVTVFARQGGDLYDHFEIDLTSGGRNAVPLSTANDLDHTTGDFYLLYDGETTAPSVGDVVVGATSGAEAEVVAITDWGTSGLLELISVSGEFQDNENLEVGGSVYCVVNGTLGDTYMKYDGESGTIAVGTIYYVSGGSTARRKLVGKQDDTGTGKVVLLTDPENDSGNESKHYIKFADNETFTDGTNSAVVNEATEGYSFQSAYWYRDVQIVFVNMELDYDGGTADMSVGDTVVGATSGAQGYILKAGATQASGTITIGNWNGTAFQDNENLQVGGATKAVANGTGKIITTTNYAFEQDTAYPYAVVIRLNHYGFSEGKTVAEMYEFLKEVLSQDKKNGFLQHPNMYPRYLDIIGGAKADDGGTITDELTEARDSSADDMTLLPATPAVDDAYYFGSLSQFGKLRLNITTAGAGTWTLTWEYWNGAWVALNWQGAAGVGESATDFSQFTPAAAGWGEVWWDIPTDWSTTAVDGDTMYWVRARVSAYTSVTTQPLGGQAYLFELGDKKLDGEEYILAYDGYALKKASPLGTFAGGIFFGAQGVWIENMASADVQAFQLIDANGTVRNPPNKQACEVTGLVSGDRVTVFITSAGSIKTDTFTSSTGNNAGDSDFVVQETIATANKDTPASGVLRIVDISTGLEHRMRYDSWSGSTFTLLTEVTGTTTADGGTNTITDSGASFTSDDIKTGDIVRNATDGSWAQVVSVDSDTQVTTTPLQGGTGDTWDSGDTYSFHTLPVTYVDSTDTAYVPIIDQQATSTSVSITVIYQSDRPIMVRNRIKGIVPWETTGTFGSTGFTVKAVRTTDSIYQ